MRSHSDLRRLVRLVGGLFARRCGQLPVASLVGRSHAATAAAPISERRRTREVRSLHEPARSGSDRRPDPRRRGQSTSSQVSYFARVYSKITCRHEAQTQVLLCADLHNDSCVTIACCLLLCNFHTTALFERSETLRERPVTTASRSITHRSRRPAASITACTLSAVTSTFHMTGCHSTMQPSSGC